MDISQHLQPLPAIKPERPADPRDPRLGQVIRVDAQALQSAQAVLVGCSDEAGLLLNHGRPGARLGPGAIRQALHRLTVGCHPPLIPDNLRLADAGDVIPDDDMGETHRRVRAVTGELCRPDRAVVLLGGSHELSAPGIEGLAAQLADEGSGKPGVLLLDAHLDVRDLRYGCTNGSPFYSLISTGVVHGAQFSVVGARSCANAPGYAAYVAEVGGRITWMHDLAQQSVEAVVTEELDRLASAGPVAVSLDIDVVNQAAAPGTGSPTAAGLDAAQLVNAAWLAGAHPAVRYLDVMEVSPPLDRDGCTALLAASAIHAFLSGLATRRLT